MKTFLHSCGCISQFKTGGSLNWVYCGNHDCPFDELGKHRKHRPGKQPVVNVVGQRNTEQDFPATP